MSGIFFDNPGVRFSRRFSFFPTRMRSFASRLFRWLTGADGHCFRSYSRRHEAEFPAATQIADQFFGSRAKDCASTDALRPKYNWVELEDPYDISIIGEKWPAFARRLPQKGRPSPAPPERAFEGAGEEIVLAENHGALCWWETGGETSPADHPKRFGAFALAA